MSRVILHIDMDAFFAAIEQRDRPEFRGRPLIVGAMPGSRGVVSTCSYEARRFGVRSAMPISRAYKLCPQGVYVPPDHHKYVEVSRQVMTILDRLSPQVEPVSVDEAFVDISGLERLFGAPAAIGQRAKEMIREATQLTSSAGIGPNRLIAKIASDYRKPDGLTVVEPAHVLDFLSPLPVGRLWGVGPRMQAALAAMSVRTVGDLRAWPVERLRQRFGEACAEHLWRQARGEASDEVGGEWERKQISKETTFEEDERDPDVIRDTLLELSAGVGRSARQEARRGLTVTLKIRFPDFETHTRQRTLAHAVSTDRQVFAAARELYAEANRGGRPVRLIGVGLSDWEPAAGRQLDLCFVDEEKEARLFAAVDRIAERFGRDVIGLGAVGARKTGRRERPPRGGES